MLQVSLLLLLSNACTNRLDFSNGSSARILTCSKYKSFIITTKFAPKFYRLRGVRCALLSYIYMLYKSVGVAPQTVIRSVSRTAVRMNAVSVNLQRDKDMHALPHSS